MKVNTAIKKIVEVELTTNDAREALKNYQMDLLHDLATALKCNHPLEQYELFWNLMQGEKSDWFDEITQKHAIFWIYTPNDWSSWGELIEEFPHIFIHNAVNLFEDVKADTLKVVLDGQELNSQKIIDNL